MSKNWLEFNFNPEKTFKVGNLKVEIYKDRLALGQAAANHAATTLQQVLTQKGKASVIFAAAPSQNEFLANLASANNIDWPNLSAFHLDEYLGLSSDAPQSFQTYLKKHLFNLVKPGKVNYLHGDTTDPEGEATRYASLLENTGLDLACIGIGENGHIAFNDPPLTNFSDQQMVRVVDLDITSRVQQVHDGCFSELDFVPRQALTVTIPTIFAAKTIICVVPGPTKAQAVFDSLSGPITALCPASILREHLSALLMIDQAAASLLDI